MKPVLVAAALTLVSAPASAQSSREHSPFASAPDALVWALEEMCVPHVFEGRAPADLVKRKYISKQPRPAEIFRSQGVPAYQVNFKGPVVVGFGGLGERACTITVSKGEAVGLRQAALDTLRARGLTLAPWAPSPGVFVRREVLCAESGPYGAMMSSGATGAGRGGALVLTVSELRERSAYCAVAAAP